MPEDGIPERAITKSELADLADLFDKFEFAFDPLSTSAKEAESKFDDIMREIFEQKVPPAYPHLSFIAFSFKIRSVCREFLRKNNS